MLPSSDNEMDTCYEVIKRSDNLLGLPSQTNENPRKLNEYVISETLVESNDLYQLEPGNTVFSKSFCLKKIFY